MIIVLVPTIVLLVNSPVDAEMVQLKNGRKLHGTIVSRTPTEVVVQLPIGTVSFTPDEVFSVEQEPSKNQATDRSGEADHMPQRSTPSQEERVGEEQAQPKQGDEATAGEKRRDADGVPLQEAMRAVAFIGVQDSWGVGKLGSGSS